MIPIWQMRKPRQREAKAEATWQIENTLYHLSPERDTQLSDQDKNGEFFISKAMLAITRKGVSPWRDTRRWGEGVALGGE